MSEQNGISYLTPPRPVSEIQREARRSASAQEVAALMFVKMAQEGQLYRSIHDVKDAGQNRKPSETPSMWTPIGNPLEEFPEWVQPIGAHDAYSKDAKTSHNGKKWVSEVDGNVWEPGVYGWAEYSEPEPQEAPQEAQGGASEEPGE